MHLELLQRLARSRLPIVFCNPSEVTAFRSLFDASLVTGTLISGGDETTRAIGQSVTLDGKALLALADYMARMQERTSEGIEQAHK